MRPRFSTTRLHGEPEFERMYPGSPANRPAPSSSAHERTRDSGALDPEVCNLEWKPAIETYSPIPSRSLEQDPEAQIAKMDQRVRGTCGLWCGRPGWRCAESGQHRESRRNFRQEI